MRRPKEKQELKPYTAPTLTVHGDVREVTRSVNGTGALDGKTKGMSGQDFKTG